MNTTLNQIRVHLPCSNGWAKLLKHLGKTQADNEPLSIVTILESNGLDDALWCLRAVYKHSKEIRLYAVWCARQVQFLMTSKESIAALDVAERHASGLATDSELATARGAAYVAARDAARDAALYAARDTAHATARFEAQDAACAAAHDAACGAARAATYAAARVAALYAARDTTYDPARDTLCDSAWHAAQSAARAAALYAARDTAYDPAWDAAYDATYDAAYNAACAAQEQELLRICGKVTEGSAA